MSREYELIPHGVGRYRLFLVDLLYRTPHIHRDFEISLVLSGEIYVNFVSETLRLSKDDLFLANPFDIHELQADKPVCILSLQVSPSFFEAAFPEIDQEVFTEHFINKEHSEPVRRRLCSLARKYLRKEPFYELDCASDIMSLSHMLLKTVPYRKYTEKELLLTRQKSDRLRNILDYVDKNYHQKILLSDLAEQEHLSLYYLSHLFSDSMGMSFQEYLSHVRCEQARRLFLSSDCSLLDVSLRCGFSDPKYFNRDFTRQYGCSPKEYRKKSRISIPYPKQTLSLTTQDILSESESLGILEQYFPS